MIAGVVVALLCVAAIVWYRNRPDGDEMLYDEDGDHIVYDRTRIRMKQDEQASKSDTQK